MSVRTRVDAPRREPSGRAARAAEKRAAQVVPRRGEPAAPRRVEQADRVKSGAAQRAYARRRNRAQGLGGLPPLPGRAASAMAGRLPFVTAIIALLGCGLMVTLLLTTRAAEDSYQLGDARRINRQLGDERAALQREVAAADSAPELANRARELGMIPAKDPSRLLIAPDGTITVIGKETPEQGAPAPPLNTLPSSPSALPPKLVQAQGERLVPVTTTPTQPGTNQASQPAHPGADQAGQPPAAPTQPGAEQPVTQQVPADQNQAPPAQAEPTQPPAEGAPIAEQAPQQASNEAAAQSVPASAPLDQAVPVPNQAAEVPNSPSAAQPVEAAEQDGVVR
ncbi:hypothetical protein [Nocardia blacklockiae]|uniref:hypothetical protein n=1 Tax=Nocardia blacklockiae TaxID=480036 RepID=UPI0018930DAE|nr:hypothetical protein [Nocardia blacklockiae]MBF6174140.1 hypothetical protein [Nocardia blacklockiae]